MNIFALDNDVKVAAQWHVDKHVVKMPLETAQMLCTARHELGEKPESIPYKVAHKNHPCTIWCRNSSENYDSNRLTLSVNLTTSPELCSILLR